MNKMVDYEYFMDRMADYELSVFFENIDYAYVMEWAQTRTLLYGVIASHADPKKFKQQPKDLFPLVTDGDGVKYKQPDEMTSDEQERIKNLFMSAQNVMQVPEKENIKEE